MPKFRIISRSAERSHEFRFMTILKFPLDTDDPILFLLNGVYQVGHWFPNIAGSDWIMQSDRAIRIIKGSANISIVGLIVPLEVKPCWN